MHSSPKQERLRQLLQAHYVSLQQTFPSNKHDALLALIDANNRHYLQTWQNDSEYTLTGLQKALSLCFSTENSTGEMPIEALDAWAHTTLQACRRLAEAERILAYCESGFLHMQQGNDTDYNVWVAGRKMPTEWREQRDLEDWTKGLKQTYVDEWNTLDAEKVSIQQQLAAFLANEGAFPLYTTTRGIDDYYHRLGMLYVRCMTASTTYPSDTTIGGCTFATYQDVLGVLIVLTLKHMDVLSRDSFSASFVAINHGGWNSKWVNVPQSNQLGTGRDESVPTDDTLLINLIAETLRLDHGTARLALDALTLDAENVSYHTAIMEVPAPPLIRLDAQHRIVSLQGLLTYPLFFLLRELKRRYSSEYHTASQLREEVFRQDVYGLFADRRFVKSAGPVELRGTKGTLTTDVDALIFDRKTGALALFELKSQDPFAYSMQERIRQRDYFYGASKQVIAAHEWVKRNGANALLNRLDSAQVKRLKAQNVYIFVLGRYLAHFFDGAPFDGRAAWGTWSQVLRLVQGKPFEANEANPIQSLYNKLTRDTPLFVDKPLAFQEIEIGDERIRVYPSFERYRRSSPNSVDSKINGNDETVY